MSSKLVQLKGVDQRTKDSVTGFVKNAQKLFNSEENAYYIIPPLIIHLIISFCRRTDCFKHFDIEIYEHVGDDCKIKYISGKYSGKSIYGELILKPSTSISYVYKFEIIAMKSTIDIGITEATAYSSVFYMDRDTNNYAYSACRGEIWSNGRGKVYGEQFGANDIITMQVDFKDMTIAWSKNDTMFEALPIKNVEDGYKMAVYMNRKGNFIRLLSMHTQS